MVTVFEDRIEITLLGDSAISDADFFSRCLSDLLTNINYEEVCVDPKEIRSLLEFQKAMLLDYEQLKLIENEDSKK